ncbi:MAG: TraR/DksA family transcriptional regulator [Desulfuromonadales bacterium]|nr:TraR/DksA family transcriptional regulator [Desulfuromonadales bacterium]
MEAIRKQLLQDRESLLMEIRQKKAEAAALVDSGVPDPGDMSMNISLTDFLHLLSDNHRERIMLIDEALRRLDEGSYGTCERCGEPIPMKRLEVQPFTPFCVECKEDAEREEIQRAGRPEQGKL